MSNFFKSFLFVAVMVTVIMVGQIRYMVLDVHVNGVTCVIPTPTATVTIFTDDCPGYCPPSYPTF